MKFQLNKSETSVILIVFILDSSSSIGAGLGSLDQTSSITGGYVKRDGTGVALAVDENVTAEGTYEAPTTAAQVRIGTPANMPTGFYELHFHNDLFTTADYVTIGLGGATDMAPLNLEIQLTNFNLNADASPDWLNGGRLDLILDSRATLGAGAITWTYTLTDSISGAPIDGAAVWVTSDSGGANILASGTTNDSGQVVFYLDAGTKYIWRSRSQYDFDNPDEEIIS